MVMIACEQVVKIDIPEHESQLVLSSFYEAGDSSITAYLTKSVAILSNETPDNVRGATLNLYADEVLLGQFEEVIGSTSPMYLLRLAEPLTEGINYRLTAEASDYISISATQKMPASPTISNLSYHARERPRTDGIFADALRLKVHDTSASNNCYEFRAYRRSGNNNINAEWEPNWAESFTFGIERGRDGSLLLNENLLEDNSYDVELLVYPEDTAYVDIQVEVKSISRDKYLFSKTLQAYYDAQYNPFSEPVIIHTNVENGQGIFSMENKTDVIFD